MTGGVNRLPPVGLIDFSVGATVGADGAVVVEVASGSPAARAKLAPGDVITAFKGEEVNGPRDLTRRVAATPPGTSVSLRVTRDGQPRTVDVTLGELRDAESRR